MEQQQPTLDRRYLVNAIINGKWIIIATMILVASLAAVSNYFQTLRYRAWRSCRSMRALLASPTADVASQSGYYSNIDKYFNTEKEKLNSRRMHTLFAEQLKLRICDIAPTQAMRFCAN